MLSRWQCIYYFKLEAWGLSLEIVILFNKKMQGGKIGIIMDNYHFYFNVTRHKTRAMRVHA